MSPSVPTPLSVLKRDSDTSNGKVSFKFFLTQARRARLCGSSNASSSINGFACFYCGLTKLLNLTMINLMRFGFGGMMDRTDSKEVQTNQNIRFLDMTSNHGLTHFAFK
jgi:hypothetical protein